MASMDYYKTHNYNKIKTLIEKKVDRTKLLSNSLMTHNVLDYHILYSDLDIVELLLKDNILNDNIEYDDYSDIISFILHEHLQNREYLENLNMDKDELEQRLISIIKLLLKYGANINVKFWNCPLEEVLNFKHFLPKLAKFLIDNGAKINKNCLTNKNICFPFNKFSKDHDNNKEMLNIIRILLENGADINDKIYNSVLMTGNDELIQMFMKKSPGKKVKFKNKIYAFYTIKTSFDNIQYYEAETPFHALKKYYNNNYERIDDFNEYTDEKGFVIINNDVIYIKEINID